MAFTPAGLIAAFRARFQDAEPALYRAPGRVNLIGEHTDYNLGYVLPVALEMACFVAAAPGTGGWLRAFSESAGELREWPVDVIPSARPAGDWGDYVLGVAVELHRAGFPVRPFDLFLRSTVPAGAGLSSSAALEVGVALALLAGRDLDPLELARLCRRAENHFVGMPCGIMDQFVCVFGRENAAVRIDCRSLEHEAAPLPEGVEIVAANTMVKHELGRTAYQDRVRECQEAVERIRARRPEVGSLRDACLGDLDGLPEPIRRRARHILTENQRVGQFTAACRAGDLDEMGRLFHASHRSLREDYEVSCEELDFLTEAAAKLPGVLGARMTGGGFGGCTVNLVRPEAVPDFQERLREAYRGRFGLTPMFYRCRPAAGAGKFV